MRRVPKGSLWIVLVSSLVLLTVAVGLTTLLLLQPGELDVEDLACAITALVLVVLLTGGIGVAEIAWLIGYWKRQVRERRLRAQYPDQPWQWQSDWHCRIIRSAHFSRLLLWWGAAGVTNLFVWSLIAVYLVEVREKGPGGVVAVFVFTSPFVFAGVGLLITAVYATAQYLKYGRTVLRLGGVPGVIGGRMDGRIEVPGFFHEREEDATVWLHCCRHIRVGSGKNRSTQEWPLWTAKRYVAVQDDAGRLSVPVAFTIPYGCEETDMADPPIVWKVVVRLEMRGLDLQTEFEVPVFKTADSDPGITEAPEERPQDDPITAMDRAGIVWGRREPGAASLSIESTGKRHPQLVRSGIWAVATLFVVLATLASAGALFLHYAMGIVFGLLAILVLLGLWPLWTKYAVRIHLTIDDQKLAIERFNTASGKRVTETIPRIRILRVHDRFANSRHGETFHDVVLDYYDESRQRQKTRLVPVVSDRYLRDLQAELRRVLERV